MQIDDEIPLPPMSIYLFRYFGPCLWHLLLELRRPVYWGRLTRETQSGGEFGWGGTSVKR